MATTEDKEDTIIVSVLRNCSDGDCSYDKHSVVRVPRSWALKVMKEFIAVDGPDGVPVKSYALVESNESDLKKYESDQAKKAAKG